MIPLLLTSALAAPPGFEARGRADGCTLFLGETEDDGVVPMRAECVWPELPFEAVEYVLDRPAVQGRFARVVGVEVLEVDGDRMRVWQQHEVGLLPDREVIVDWIREDGRDGTVWRWESVSSELPRSQLPRDPDNVECTRWDGFWRVSPEGAGVRVVFDNRYETGGYPAWLVRPFLTSKLKESVLDLKRVAEDR